MPSATRIINGDSNPSTLGSTSLETAVLINSANPYVYMIIMSSVPVDVLRRLRIGLSSLHGTLRSPAKQRPLRLYALAVVLRLWDPRVTAERRRMTRPSAHLGNTKVSKIRLTFYSFKILIVDEPLAICKLFMAYAGDVSLEYIGTGFLIDDDVVVTAGHCVYDWKTKGAHLKHVRCYFGYASDESPGVYRYGIAAACPAEYLKAPSDVHDVAFVSPDCGA